MKIKIGEVYCDEKSFVPFMDLEIKTRICLDPEMFKSIQMHGESMLNLMLADYKHELLSKLEPILLEKNFSIEKNKL